MNISTREPWLSAVLSVFVYGASAAAFAFPLAVPQIVFASAIGAGAGVLVARRLTRSAIRLPAILMAAALGLLFVAGIRQILLATSWLAWEIGPASALRWTDTLCSGAAALVLAAALRLSALRFRVVAVLEIAFISAAFAQLVVAHRNGAINRPFEIADPIIAMGADPTIALLAIGAVTSLVIVLVLLAESSLARSIIHLSVAIAILALILFTARVTGLPQPAGADSLGLRADQNSDNRKKPEQRGKGNQGGRRNNQDLDFRDDYSSPINRVPVAVVLLHDDYSPPSGVYYFRQSAFSQYNGRRLVEATGSVVDRDLAGAFPVAPTAIWEVPNERGDRAAVDTTVALLADHKRPFALESPLALDPARNPDPGRFRRVYRASSASLTSDFYALIGRMAGDKRWTPEQWSNYTQTPADPRYRALAEQITGRLREQLRADPMARALAISAWLRKEGIYSLRSSHARAVDPTADFLFGDKTGYCVHFSHAAAYLMRSLGLPARIATGYVVEEAARRGGSTIVLSGENSHSWPELYLDGVGWTIVDAIPERSLDPAPQPPDPDLQRLLGEMARGERPLPYPGAQPFEPMARFTFEAVKLLGQVAVLALLAVLMMLYLVKLWRRSIPAFAGDRALPRVVYRAQLDRLADLRMRRGFGESRESFAARVAAVSPSFSPLTQTHLAWAFGSRAVSDATDLRALSGDIRTELRAARPLWRRILGAVIPWSWLESR